MQPQELRILKILEAVEEEEPPSQRDLARRLNVSLGLVNSFIKRLVNKGYVKITNIPKNRVRYLLTPKGAAEKTRLTYAYLSFSFSFYRQSRMRLAELFQQLSAKGVKRLVFFGATDLAEIAYVSIQDTGLTLVAVIDEERAGKRFLGGRVIEPPERVSQLEFDLVLNTLIEFPERALDRLREMDFPDSKLVQI